MLDSDGSSMVFNNAFDASSVKDLRGGKITTLLISKSETID